MQSQFESLWVDTSKSTKYPALDRMIEVDVAIVGGGIAGLNAAYFLAREDKKVAVIEAAHIAMGTSGYTTAKVTSLHEEKYDFLKTNHGKSGARIYAQSNQWAVEELERIVTKEKIECDLHKVNAYMYTSDKKSIERLETEYKAAKEATLPATFERNIDALPFKITAAMKFSQQAIFHPRKFLVALAEIIVKKNNYIFENTRVLEIKEGEPCELKTEKGTIKAKQVIIATNYPIYDKALLFARMDQMRSYALAVHVKDKLPTDMWIGFNYDEPTIRPYEKWLIMGGQDHPIGEKRDTVEQYKKLEEITRNLFQVQSVDYQWSAQDSSPVDRVPYIGKMPFTNHVYVTTGYGEWGMSTSFVSAKILSDLIINKPNEWSDFYKPSRINPRASLSKAPGMALHVAKGFADYLLKNEGSDLENMQPNEGRIITKDGKKLAVYKDKNGKLHALSAICTHMGCVVGWNSAERSWDCPCHGSRFDKNGTVINGPAIKNLPEEKI